MLSKITLFIFFIIYSISSIKSSKTLKDKIYYSLKTSEFNMCFRLFNLTHQVGCSSNLNGNIGTVLYLNNEHDLDKLLLPSDYAPYILLLDLQLFEGDIIKRILNSKLVNGIIISRINETIYPKHFSPDLKSPNSQYGLYQNDDHLKYFIWNSFGNGLMFENINIPFSVVTNVTAIQFIINDCYEKFNAEYFESGKQDMVPRCSIRMKDYNHGAQSTITCWRRSNLIQNLNPEYFCDPIGSHNVHGYLKPVEKNQTLENNSIILLVARLDSFSMFENKSPGVDSAVSGFVALHAIAKTLAIHKQEFTQLNKFKNILFLFLHAESFDYSGSIRYVYDIKQNLFVPLQLNSIGAIIEIGQIGCHNDFYLQDEKIKVWLHTDPVSRHLVDDQLKKIEENFVSESSSIGLEALRAPLSQPLPPASIQTFLRHVNVPAIYISNHEKDFSNKYYNSYFDEKSRSGIIYPANMSNEDKYNYETPLSHKIQLVATSVARVVTKMITSDEAIKIAVNITDISNLLFCFTVDPACQLFNESLQFGTFSNLLSKDEFLRRYVSVFFERSISPTVKQHMLLLVYHLGLHTSDNKTSCLSMNKQNEEKNYYFLNGNGSDGVCVRSEADVSPTISPAFENQEWEKYPEFPAWTESKWSDKSFQIDVFLVPIQRNEVIMLVIGLILTMITFPIIILSKRSFINRKSYGLSEL